jgi:hypothetical protein
MRVDESIFSVLYANSNFTSNSFFEQALEHTQEIITSSIEKVYADGAYHSCSNLEYCQNNEHNIDLVLTGMQGATPGYEISLNVNKLCQDSELLR